MLTSADPTNTPSVQEAMLENECEAISFAVGTDVLKPCTELPVKQAEVVVCSVCLEDVSNYVQLMGTVSVSV